jgi:hypothetical protein
MTAKTIFALGQVWQALPFVPLFYAGAVWLLANGREDVGAGVLMFAVYVMICVIDDFYWWGERHAVMARSKAFAMLSQHRRNRYE